MAYLEINFTKHDSEQTVTVIEHYRTTCSLSNAETCCESLSGMMVAAHLTLQVMETHKHSSQINGSVTEIGWTRNSVNKVTGSHFPRHPTRKGHSCCILKGHERQSIPYLPSDMLSKLGSLCNWMKASMSQVVTLDEPTAGTLPMGFRWRGRGTE